MYSLIDKETRRILSCGLNSYSLQEIKRSVLYYVRSCIEDTSDLLILHKSSLDDIFALSGLHPHCWSGRAMLFGVLKRQGASHYITLFVFH